MMRIAAVLLIGLMSDLTSGCGGRPPPPPRGVVEGDLGSWRFRRYQPVLDVEVWVEGNTAAAYTATYVRGEAEKQGRLGDRDLVSVFVTRYEKDDGVAQETARFAKRLAKESGYEVEETEIGGVRALSIRGHGEVWVMWTAARHVVKVGGRGRDDVPESVVEAYAERYPSTLASGALRAPLPAEKAEPAAPYDPNNPTPDWDSYDSKRGKTTSRPKKK